MGCCWKSQGRNRVDALIFIVALIAGFGVLSGNAARPFFLLGSLPRGTTPDPPECTNVPGNGGGGHCPAVNEMHYAVRPPPVPASSSLSHASALPRHASIEFGH
ncbi:hypothetical protein H6P81_015508 [Aristolochia fimbriata]|uniref:Uncharacterized protein n=1 Tax=Aristolochia fimbriata TaxID=158543 RepID=A0AAV7EAC8_ARIFI|nr:hypothetical protein H6P81_015508 [Aristolochia fimbriata]